MKAAQLGAPSWAVIQILWLGQRVLGRMGPRHRPHHPGLDPLVKWFLIAAGWATGLAIGMRFGFGAAIGGPVSQLRDSVSDVAASSLGMPEAHYRAGISNYNAAGANDPQGHSPP